MSLNISEAIRKQVGTIKNTYRPLQQGHASDVAVVSNHKKDNDFEKLQIS